MPAAANGLHSGRERRVGREAIRSSLASVAHCRRVATTEIAADGHEAEARQRPGQVHRQMAGRRDGCPPGGRSQVAHGDPKPVSHFAGELINAHRGLRRDVILKKRRSHAGINRPALDAGAQSKPGKPAVECPIAVGRLGQRLNGVRRELDAPSAGTIEQIAAP